MKRRMLAAVGLGGCLAAAYWMYGDGNESTATSLEGANIAQSAEEGSAAPPRHAGRSDAETIEQLEAQLQRQQQLLAAMMLRGDSDEAATIGTTPNRAARLLDQRLFDAPRAPADPGRLEAALEPVLALLDAADLDSQHACGSTMCRISVQGDLDTIGSALTRAVEALPKDFAGSTLIETGEEIIVYAATSSPLLDTTEDPAPQP